MTEEEFIWISKWERFQHYKPDPSRGPKWIKTYTDQLTDTNYLSLNDKQRSVLHELRMLFSIVRGKLPKDTRYLSGVLAQRVTEPTLQRLNHAGFIEFCSRETLEQRLDKFYSRSRAEVEKEEKETPKAVTSQETPTVPQPETNGLGDTQLEDFLTQIGAAHILKEMP